MGIADGAARRAGDAARARRPWTTRGRPSAVAVVAVDGATQHRAPSARRTQHRALDMSGGALGQLLAEHLHVLAYDRPRSRGKRRRLAIRGRNRDRGRRRSQPLGARVRRAAATVVRSGPRCPSRGSQETRRLEAQAAPRAAADTATNLHRRAYRATNDIPDDVLGTGALIPTGPPRRVAFYGCDCGEFGCSNVAGLIIRRGDRVEWTDFLSVTGVYDKALADPTEGPDPGADKSWLPPKPHDLPTFTFDADQYMTAVRAATTDRTWETRPHAVVRHLRSLRPGTNPYPVLDGESITVHHRVNDMATSTDLPVPPGPVDRLAESLLRLLDQGNDPRRIAAENLWQ